MKTITEAEYNELKRLAEEAESLKKKNKWLLEAKYKHPHHRQMGYSDIEMQSAVPAAVAEQMSQAEFTGPMAARRAMSALDISVSRRDSGNIVAPLRYSFTDFFGSASHGGHQPLEKGPSPINLSRENSKISIAIQRTLTNQIVPSVFARPVVRPHKEDIKLDMDAQPVEMKYIEHQFDLARLSEYFRTHINVDDVRLSGGLSADQAAYNLQTHGPNLLTPPPRVPLWMLFLLQFTNLFMILLMVAGLLSIIAWAIAPSDFTNLYLGILLFVIVFFTCYETYSQEAKSDQLMETFRAMIPESANVIRDGIIAPLKVDQLVCGDIIRLKSGDKVPADCRVILTESMKVDQSMITGESEPVDSTVDMADRDPLEAKNIIFNGSLVVDGGCLAVIVRTGDDTLIGTMVGLTEDAGKASSTLKCDVEHFVVLLTKFALVQAIIVFVVGCVRGIDPLEAFIQGFIIVMCANVPQGLPSVITAALFVVAERMGKQNVFVKKLDVIETLGSCSVICTDKTGTLTMNLMSVANLWVPNLKCTAVDASIRVQESTPDMMISSLKSGWQQLAAVATLNSRVILQKKDDQDDLQPTGDATELGLYRYFSGVIQMAWGMEIETFRESNPKVFEIPFNSSNKWQLSIHRVAGRNDTRKEVLFLKGAPDVLLSKCGFYMAASGAILPINDTFLRLYTEVYEGFGGEGERVLGFAMKQMTIPFAEEVAANPNYEKVLKENMIGTGRNPIKDLVFVGLVTLMDPPRPEVPKAVIDCHTAGVKVIMVTGDHPLTAAAIARNIGLITKPTKESIAKERGIEVDDVDEAEAGAVVVHGSQIPAMTDDDWVRLIAKDEIVFARTSPEQKLIIVKKLTEAGNVVAMTGDGVNDSPALKQAAIGVAMGMNGSDVAREAADIVLLDDNFASIVVGIREGRLLFANLKKSVAYTLTHLVPEVLPTFLWAFVGCPLALGSIQVLCIDLLTEILPSTSLGFENPEANIMKVPPRDPKKDRLTSTSLLLYSYCQMGIIETGVCMFIFLYYFHQHGVSAYDLMTMKNKAFPGTDRYTSSSGESFSGEEQAQMLAIVQGSFYLMIVINQAMHVWNIRTTVISIFEHGIFTNNYTNWGTLGAVALGCFIVYTPGVQSITLTGDAPSLLMLYGALLSAACIFGWGELRKYVVRNFSHIETVKEFVAF